jgi:tetratricopeptide (TPR) repeat protein
MKSIYSSILLLFLVLTGCSNRALVKNETTVQTENLIKARDHFTSGMFHELDGNHKEALLEYYEALLYDTTSHTIYNRIAENHMKIGNYESALRYLEKAKRRTPENTESLQLEADCYFRLNRDEAAIAAYNQVLKVNPYDENARSLLLILYRKTGNERGVAEQYQEMIDLYGENEDWVRKAGLIYLQLGDTGHSLDMFLQFLAKDSTNASFWFTVGGIYEMNQENDKAMDAYQHAIRHDPLFEDAAQKIYNMVRRSDNWEQAIAIFKPVVAENPQVVIARLALAEGYKNTGKADECRSTLKPMIEKDVQIWQLYDIIGRLELDEQNFSQAAKYFRKIIDIDRSNRLGWLFLGFTYSDMDSLDKAEENYRRALRYLPDDPHILTYYGLTLSRQQRDEEALLPLEKAVKIDSTNVNALLGYGLTLNSLERYEEAIRPLNLVLKYDEKNMAAFSTLGFIYDALQWNAECDSLYHRALRIYPDNALLQNNYAYSLSERDEQLDYALQLSRAAVKEEPDNAAYLDTIGWILYKLGNYTEALSYIQKSLDNREESAVVIEHLGDVLFKLDRVAEARAQWQRALDLDPANENLKQKLGIE